MEIKWTFELRKRKIQVNSLSFIWAFDFLCLYSGRNHNNINISNMFICRCIVKYVYRMFGRSKKKSQPPEVKPKPKVTRESFPTTKTPTDMQHRKSAPDIADTGLVNA